MSEERKEIITPQDMMQILGGCSYGQACKKIREVKSVSNRLNIKGQIHILDWQDYLNRFSKVGG
ncbi:MAG: hypothetical protein IJX25_00085 [Clostridia bacterium]|nr:hypothetical protein [Clostridia bacterium]